VDKKEIFITAIKSNEGLLYKIAAIYTNTIEDRNDLVQEIILDSTDTTTSKNRKRLYDVVYLSI